MTVSELTNQILALPAAQRATVAQKLWESLDDSQVSISRESEKEAVALALERDAELSRGEKVARSHDEVMENARRCIQCE